MAKIKCINTGPRVATLKTSRFNPVTKRDRGRPWQRLRQRALERDGYLCVECAKQGRVAHAREVDHIVPLHQGGKDELSNLQGLCLPCHQSKTADETKGRGIDDLWSR